ncbi:MAG: RloB family protein [Legionellales bacterium]
MASKKKPDPNRFAPQTSGRRIGFRPERRYYLIVCEGEKTEPNYFEGLKKKLPPGVLSNYEIDVKGEGRNTQSLIDKAIEYKDKLESNTTRKVDKIWVVFDKDSFSDRLFNAAIHSCDREDIEIACAWSNEAFELWYLLHFAYYDSQLSRDQYAKKIEAHFKKAGNKDFKYAKNHPDMFALLEDKIQTAIRNAKKLKATHTGKDHANHNPCTTVHDLVLELLTL